MEVFLHEDCDKSSDRGESELQASIFIIFYDIPRRLVGNKCQGQTHRENDRGSLLVFRQVEVSENRTMSQERVCRASFDRMEHMSFSTAHDGDESRHVGLQLGAVL